MEWRTWKAAVCCLVEQVRLSTKNWEQSREAVSPIKIKYRQAIDDLKKMCYFFIETSERI